MAGRELDLELGQVGGAARRGLGQVNTTKANGTGLLHGHDRPVNMGVMRARLRAPTTAQVAVEGSDDQPDRWPNVRDDKWWCIGGQKSNRVARKW